MIKDKINQDGIENTIPEPTGVCLVDNNYVEVSKTEIFKNTVITHSNSVLRLFMGGKEFSTVFLNSSGEPININRIGFIGNKIVVLLDSDEYRDSLFVFNINNSLPFDYLNFDKFVFGVSIYLNFDNSVFGISIKKIAFAGGVGVVMLNSSTCRFLKIKDNGELSGLELKEINRVKFERVFNNSIVIKAFLKHTAVSIETGFNGGYDNGK